MPFPVTISYRLRTSINNMFRILAQHWKGNLPLWWTFIVNFVPASVLVLLALRYDWVAVAGRSDVPLVIIVSVIVLIALFVVVWQVTGMLRTLNRQMAGVGGVADSGYVYVLLFVYAWLLLIALLDLSRFIHIPEKSVLERPQTSLSVHSTRGWQSAQIKGDLEFGLTKHLTNMLTTHPGITHLELNSAGGIVSEARGVARLVKQWSLNTHVEEFCYSACTLVFIASARRTLGPSAQLGFHQYSMDKKFNTPWIDPVQEQRRDAAFMLEQGVQQHFVEKAYSEPHTGLWRPSHQVLLDANVVSEILP